MTEIMFFFKLIYHMPRIAMKLAMGRLFVFSDAPYDVVQYFAYATDEEVDEVCSTSSKNEAEFCIKVVVEARKELKLRNRDFS